MITRDTKATGNPFPLALLKQTLAVASSIFCTGLYSFVLPKVQVRTVRQPRDFKHLPALKINVEHTCLLPVLAG